MGRWLKAYLFFGQQWTSSFNIVAFLRFWSYLQMPLLTYFLTYRDKPLNGLFNFALTGSARVRKRCRWLRKRIWRHRTTPRPPPWPTYGDIRFPARQHGGHALPAWQRQLSASTWSRVWSWCWRDHFRPPCTPTWRHWPSVTSLVRRWSVLLRAPGHQSVSYNSYNIRSNLYYVSK